MKRPVSKIRRLSHLFTVALSTATLSIMAIAPVLANYVPPSDGPAPRASTPGGVRTGGCSAAATTGLIPLAPKSHIGQTVSTQPTFAWFSPEGDSYLTEFRVAEHRDDGGFEVIYKTEFDSDTKVLPSGITAFSLSETDVQLSPGTVYRWQVVLVCNPNRPSESLVAHADITVVDASTIDVTTVPDAVERSLRYAEASLWYDALREALTADSANGQDIQISLLEDLVAIEDQADRAENEAMGEVPHGDRLRQVIAAISVTE
ncbi:MAG: DUF928 domain-containing protein [Synechococcales bacterium]|nr:DUF928 domain-containing protein [Synechococcales bacterium]